MTPAWAARVTADGRGAVAVVRIWGPGALAAADAAFRPNRGAGLAETPVGRPRVGRVGAGPGDEVVAVAIAEAVGVEVEIQCHGGPAAVSLVLDALHAAGASRSSPELWAQQSYPSPLAAQAGADLARAATRRAAEVLLDQADGTLDAAVRAIRSRIHPDPAAALAALDTLIGTAAFGTRLVGGWRVAIAGRPNAGKSRLLNALVGFDRAIVAPTPGTTRDVVTARVALGGWPVEIADTAGLRDADDPIERAGVALAQARQADADLVILALDRSEPLNSDDLAQLGSFRAVSRVATKSDLPAAWDASSFAALPVSAERGDGLDELVAALAVAVVPQAPPPGSAVVFRAGQEYWLRSVISLLTLGDTTRAAEACSRLLAGEAWPGPAPADPVSSPTRRVDDH